MDISRSNQAGNNTPWNRRLSFWIVILCVVVALGIIKQYRHAANNKQKTKAAPVVVSVAEAQDVPVYLNALGGVTPLFSVTVRTQINGILMRVLFQEGQTVKAGELLAEIDSRPYEAQLVQYEGQLARDQALLDNARIDLKRYQTLWKQDSVSQQTLATQQSLVRQYEGDVQTDLGLIQTTKVNLIYCKIVSPVEGRIGLRLVDAGNFVQTSDSGGIAVVNTLDPITVIFTIPEDNIPEVVKKINAGEILQAEAYDRAQTKLLATGNLLTIDNQVNTSTGTVRLKAQFENKANRLFPNQFVNIRLLVKTLRQAIVVPTAAIQYGAKENFVYVLNADQTVSMKSVTVGVTTGDITVIKSGVSAGQSVVIEGSDNLTDKAKVSVAATKPIASAMQSVSNSPTHYSHERVDA